jgi:hypothetical protein
MARLICAAATPNTLDLGLREIELADDVPGPQHRTAGRAILEYVIGVSVRSAKVTLILLSLTEKDNFRSFYRTTKAANTRWTFIPDAVYHPTDVWSVKFTSNPSYAPKKLPSGRICWEVSFDIEDAPVTL